MATKVQYYKCRDCGKKIDKEQITYKACGCGCMGICNKCGGQLKRIYEK